MAGLGIAVAGALAVPPGTADEPRTASRPTPPGGPGGATSTATAAREGGRRAADTLAVPAGTRVRVTLRDTLSTRSSSAGDTFRVELAEPVYDGDRVALPAGAVVTGRVAEARESRGVRERAVLHTGFLHVEVGGRKLPFRAELVETSPVMRSRTTRLERVAKIAGGALLGGLAGAYLTGGTGALAGAAVGGLAGALWVMSTQDVDAVLPAGSRMRLRLTREIEVSRPGARSGS